MLLGVLFIQIFIFYVLTDYDASYITPEMLLNYEFKFPSQTLIYFILLTK